MAPTSRRPKPLGCSSVSPAFTRYKFFIPLTFLIAWLASSRWSVEAWGLTSSVVATRSSSFSSFDDVGDMIQVLIENFFYWVQTSLIFLPEEIKGRPYDVSRTPGHVPWPDPLNTWSFFGRNVLAFLSPPKRKYTLYPLNTGQATAHPASAPSYIRNRVRHGTIYAN